MPFSSAITIFTRRPGVGQECSEAWCPLLEALDPVLLAVWTGVAMVLALAAATYVRRAQDECENERARTRAERVAFAEFAERVREIEPVLAPVGDAHPGETLVRSKGTDARLERVQDAYRETVMAVPHYESEFGEPLALNMTAELGEEVTPAVLDGSGFTPQLQQALVTKSEGACRQRLSLEDRIDREAATLDRVAETFESVETRLERLNETPLSEQSFEDLERTYRELASMGEECREVVDDRQETVRSEFHDGPGDDEGPTNFYHYLYHPLEVDYPVLADGASVLDTIETAKRNVRLALTRRV